MILMAALVRLRVRTIAIIGPGDHHASQRATASAHKRGPALADLWKVLYIGFFNGPVGGTPLIVLYSIIPWIGVMAAVYAFGTILTMEPARATRFACGSDSAPSRRSWCCGAPTCTVIPDRGARRRRCRRSSHSSTRLNTRRRSVFCDDARATIALIPLLDRARGRVANWLAIFGRVPFFYYCCTFR